MIIQEKSSRLEFTDKLSKFIIDNSLADPYGGDIIRGIDRKNRAYYSVSFSILGMLDGTISVYSHKYFVLKFRAQLSFLPSETTRLFKNQDDLLTFIKVAFVDRDSIMYSLINKGYIES